MCGLWRRGVVSVSVAFTPFTLAPTGGVLETLTVFTTAAASASARVTTCPEVVVQLIDALGASDAPGQLISSANVASVTARPFKVTLPSLVTTYLSLLGSALVIVQDPSASV